MPNIECPDGIATAFVDSAGIVTLPLEIHNAERVVLENGEWETGTLSIWPDALGEQFHQITAFNECGWSQCLLQLVLEETPPPLTKFKLYENFPEPFNPVTSIRFDLPQNCHVALRIYNERGALVATLLDEEREMGMYTVQWRGLNEQGRPVSSGAYLYKIEAGEFSDAKKMILIH